MLRPDIEVWQAWLDLGATDLNRCETLLSNDELLRADRFYFERDRRRFVVARSKLRQLLGGYLEIAPTAIVFDYMKNGKPYIYSNSAQIHFNVSHSEEFAIYAISRTCHLGVDIEYLNREIDWQVLARRFFAHSEFTCLENLAQPIRERAFFACWTRKEAIVKATGDGLSLPLDQFEVTVEHDAEPRLLAAATLQIANWKLYTLDAGDDYVATVASYRPDSRVK